MDGSSARMTLFGSEHATALACIAVGAILLVLIARRVRGTRAECRVTCAAGWVLLVVAVGWLLWGMIPAHWTIEQSLPFHYSDVLRIVTAVALITRAGWAIAITYYWGLTLNLQSVLTPDLNYEQYPVLEFTVYWILHALVLWAPIVLVWGLGYRPTWRGFGVAYGAALGWAVVAMTVNAATGANYGYLSRPPAGFSVLDLLGGWPWYIGVEIAVVAVVWMLMTWPWSEPERLMHAPVVDRWRLVRRWDGTPPRWARTLPARERSKAPRTPRRDG